MIYLRILVIGAVVTVAVAVIVVIFRVPVASVTESAPPVIVASQRIRLDYGLVTLNQTVALPQPTPNELALRVWVQRLPAYTPYLTVYASSGGRRYGPSVVELPPPDGAFHPIDLPWWKLPADANSISLAIKGDGVLLLTTKATGAQAAPLKINGVARPDSEVALQLSSRQSGLEEYVPLLRIAEGKPGMLGWPKLLLVLLVVTAITLAVFTRLGSAFIGLAGRAYAEQTARRGSENAQ